MGLSDRHADDHGNGGGPTIGHTLLFACRHPRQRAEGGHAGSNSNRIADNGGPVHAHGRPNGHCDRDAQSNPYADALRDEQSHSNDYCHTNEDAHPKGYANFDRHAWSNTADDRNGLR